MTSWDNESSLYKSIQAMFQPYLTMVATCLPCINNIENLLRFLHQIDFWVYNKLNLSVYYLIWYWTSQWSHKMFFLFWIVSPLRKRKAETYLINVLCVFFFFFWPFIFIKLHEISLDLVITCMHTTVTFFFFSIFVKTPYLITTAYGNRP